MLKYSCERWGRPRCGEKNMSQIVWIYSDTSSGWKWVITFLIHLTISVTWSSVELFVVSVVAMERGIVPVVFQLYVSTFSNTTAEKKKGRGNYNYRYEVLVCMFHLKENKACVTEKQRALAVWTILYYYTIRYIVALNYKQGITNSCKIPWGSSWDFYFEGYRLQNLYAVSFVSTGGLLIVFIAVLFPYFLLWALFLGRHREHLCLS